MIDPIPLSVPCIRGREAQYLKECLDSNWVSYAGPFVPRFEMELAAKAGAAHAVATVSGTSALHVALLLAGVGENDELVMPGLTFVAPANAIRYCGAWPVLIDVSADDWQIDIAKLEKFLDDGCEVQKNQLTNKSTGRRIAALMPVHLLGGMCDVDAVASLASRYGLPLIEDAAECLGATYKDRPIGAPCPAYRGPLRLVVTSFNGNKTITTGGGGAILSEDASLAARARHLTTTAKVDGIEFVHDEVGYNYRMTNVAAAMGVAQLELLDDFVEVKRNNASRYRDLLGSSSHLRLHPEPPDCRSTFWMYSITLDREARPVIDALNHAGVMSRPIWTPIDDLPPYAGQAFSAGLPVAHEIHRTGLSLPCSVGLTDAQSQRVAEALLGALI